ncbi:hypothetical protein [Peloplasma aerotolerans]|uniref:DRTGG domain-containing protein n=1 Tax=Peloplasma aerotolerans TaxID=3044389 RepID=A0AAW6U4C6_9MOLU|nr:hypothetical protein [Mariniplasma sp. M4Ah]MDI6452715.1 hypothetical protein [Mariniplasma sp. M4Ah]
MKLFDIVSKYDCKVYTPDIMRNIEINYAFCSDLMSDALMILNSVKDNGILSHSVLITGLTNNQSIRTAEMLDVEVVLLVRGKIPSTKVIDLANESNIMLIATESTMFNTSGMMYQDGIKGVRYHQQW